MSGFCPFAVVKNITPGSNDPAIKPRVAILHVDAGNASSLFDFFKFRSGGIESHFHVKADGTIEQYRSIYFQADANHLANDFAVSIETQGLGPGKWTPAQLESIKHLLVWLNKEAGIPLRKVQEWNGSGIGYHVQFGSPGMWTPVSKSCPGPERIKQFHSVLVPWMPTALNPPAPEPKPTPNITAALTKDRDTRRKALHRVVEHSDSKVAVRAATSYLRAMELQDKARAKAAAARAKLKKEEVRP